MNLKSKVISGLRWSATAKFLGQLVTWGITIVVIRLLSPADYGLMALAGVFVAFLAMLNELGLGSAVVQRKDLDLDSLRSLFGLVLLTSIGFYLLLAAVAPLIAAFYEEPRLVGLIRVLSLQFVIVGFSVLPQSILLRDMKFREIAAADFVSTIAGSLTTLLLALQGQGVWALVWGSLVIRIVSASALNLVQPFFHWPRLAIRGMAGVFAFGGYVTLSRILWYFYSKADTLILGKILGKDLLGFYSVGMYLATLPMEKISGIINQVAFPAFSNVQAYEGVPGMHFLKAVRVMSFFAFPLLWGISGIAPEAISVFLGAKWSQASLPLQIIALVVPIRMVSNLMNPALLGMGRPDLSFTNSLVAFVVMPVAFLIGSFWGLTGVSVAWTIAFPLVFMVNLHRVSEVLNIRVRNVLAAMLAPFACGAVMYVSLHAVKQVSVAWTVLAKMSLLVCVGSLVYMALAVLFNRSGIQEIRDLVKA